MTKAEVLLNDEEHRLVWPPVGRLPSWLRRRDMPRYYDPQTVRGRAVKRWVDPAAIRRA